MHCEEVKEKMVKDDAHTSVQKEITREKTDFKNDIPLEELVLHLKTGPDVGLHQILKNSFQAVKEIITMYEYVKEAYEEIRKDLHNFDQDKAYNCAELAHKRLEVFFGKKVPSYHEGLLHPEEREKLSLLRRAKSALSAKKELFLMYLESIAQLEQTTIQKFTSEKYLAPDELEVEKKNIYFRKFIIDSPTDPLRQAIIILKQEEMYLPEAQLVARLNLDSTEGITAGRLFLQQEKERQGVILPWRRKFPFAEEESNFFLTGTYCTIGKEIKFKNYLRRDPYSTLLINSSHAPRKGNEEKIPKKIPLVGEIPYVWSGKEAPAVYAALIGHEKDKFHVLKYQLQQGIVVMRSQDTGKKLSFEVRTQNPKQVEARFFYGATSSREKMVAYVLNGSEEIDKECHVEFPELKK
ncbi:hypothetical protein HYX13_03145 [Candidatus Woesearchaeota archaeon]|nr:hypothetical protein [Candidatus Woesearchaeota archaeon]